MESDFLLIFENIIEAPSLVAVVSDEGDPLFVRDEDVAGGVKEANAVNCVRERNFSQELLILAPNTNGAPRT